MFSRTFASLMLLGVLVIQTLPASAYYSPSRGRFLQRDPIGYVDGEGLYEYTKSNPVRFGDPAGTEVYAFEGTAFKYGQESNTQRFYNLAVKKGGFWNGPNIAGTDCDSIVASGKKKICEDFCKAKKEMDVGYKIALVGWSRGAAESLALAMKLSGEGCCCNVQNGKSDFKMGYCGGGNIYQVYKRFLPNRKCYERKFPYIGFIGLFDAVRMTTTIPKATNDTVQSPRIGYIAHAMRTDRGERQWFKNIIFPHVQVDGRYFPKYNGETSTHNDIGTKLNNGAMLWMYRTAFSLGVELLSPSSLITPYW